MRHRAWFDVTAAVAAPKPHLRPRSTEMDQYSSTLRLTRQQQQSISQIRIFDLPRITVVKQSWYVESYSKKMSGNDWWNKYVFSLCTQKSVREEDGWISGGRLFQRLDAATGNERRPTVARRYAGTCSWCDEDERRRWRPGRSATISSHNASFTPVRNVSHRQGHHTNKVSNCCP